MYQELKILGTTAIIEEKTKWLKKKYAENANDL